MVTKRRVDMMNCGWMQTVLAIVILVFAIWPNQIFSASASQVIVIVAAALLLIHALSCRKCCGIMCMNDSGKVKGKSKKK